MSPRKPETSGAVGMAACFSASRVLTDGWTTAIATMALGLLVGLVIGYPLWLRMAARAEREAPLSANPPGPPSNVRTVD